MTFDIPPLNPPREGDFIDVRGEFAYVKAVSAHRQAKAWNTILKSDPIWGPESGFVVGVGPRMDGRYPLVWLRLPSGGPDTFDQSSAD